MFSFEVFFSHIILTYSDQENYLSNLQAFFDVHVLESHVDD